MAGKSKQVDSRDIWERAIDEPFPAQEPDVDAADRDVARLEKELRAAKKRSLDVSSKRKLSNELTAQISDGMGGYLGGAALFLGQRGLRRMIRKAPLKVWPGIILKTNAAGVAGGAANTVRGGQARQAERERRKKK